jgi:hypothetical protein
MHLHLGRLHRSCSGAAQSLTCRSCSTNYLLHLHLGRLHRSCFGSAQSLTCRSCSTYYLPASILRVTKPLHLTASTSSLCMITRLIGSTKTSVPLTVTGISLMQFSRWKIMAWHLVTWWCLSPDDLHIKDGGPRIKIRKSQNCKLADFRNLLVLRGSFASVAICGSAICDVYIICSYIQILKFCK